MLRTGGGGTRGMLRTNRGDSLTRPGLLAPERGEYGPSFRAEDDTSLRPLVEGYGRAACVLNAKTRCILKIP